MTTNPARSRVAHDSLGGDSRLRIDERGGVRFLVDRNTLDRLTALRGPGRKLQRRGAGAERPAPMSPKARGETARPGGSGAGPSEVAARATRTSIRRMGEQGLAARQKSPAQERRAGQIGALGLGSRVSAPNKQTRRGPGCSHSRRDQRRDHSRSGSGR
jgi:hypothetical protein